MAGRRLETTAKSHAGRLRRRAGGWRYVLTEERKQDTDEKKKLTPLLLLLFSSRSVDPLIKASSLFSLKSDEATTFFPSHIVFFFLKKL